MTDVGIPQWQDKLQDLHYIILHYMLIEENTDMCFEKNKACVIKLIDLVQHRGQRWAVTHTVMNLRVPYRDEYLFMHFSSLPILSKLYKFYYQWIVQHISLICMCRRLLQHVSDISYSHLQEVVNCICGQVTFVVLFVGNKLISLYVLKERCIVSISF